MNDFRISMSWVSSDYLREFKIEMHCWCDAHAKGYVLIIWSMHLSTLLRRSGETSFLPSFTLAIVTKSDLRSSMARTLVYPILVMVTLA
jgi:hypothetical protein